TPDPVDLGTGLLVYTRTDLSLPGIMPITLTRTYRQGDSASRAFGVGTTHSYNIFLVGDSFPNLYTYQDLILADGGRIHYIRTSPHNCNGPDYLCAVYEHTGTQNHFLQISDHLGRYCEAMDFEIQRRIRLEVSGCV